MKKNLYPLLFVSVIVCIILEIGFNWYFLIKKSKLYQTEVTLNIRTYHLDDNKEITAISDESIENLKKILSDDTINKLTEEFEKERTFYINFITVITILLTIIGLVPVFYGILEKNENIKLRENLENIKNEYGKELDFIKVEAFLSDFHDLSLDLKRSGVFILEDSTPVNTLEKLERHILNLLNESFENINIDLLYNKYLQSYSIEIANLLGNILAYSKRTFMTSYNKKGKYYTVKEIPILKSVLLQLKFILKNEKYSKLIECIKKLPANILDFTDLEK